MLTNGREMWRGRQFKQWTWHGQNGTRAELRRWRLIGEQQTRGDTGSRRSDVHSAHALDERTACERHGKGALFFVCDPLFVVVAERP